MLVKREVQHADCARVDGDELLSTVFLLPSAFRIWIPSEHDCCIQQTRMLPHQFNEPVRSPRKAPTNDGSVVCPGADELDELHELLWQFGFVATKVPVHGNIPTWLRA